MSLNRMAASRFIINPGAVSYCRRFASHEHGVIMNDFRQIEIFGPMTFNYIGKVSIFDR